MLEQYSVQPWDHLTDLDLPGVVLDLYAPPELEELANQVITLYDMSVSQMTLITSKPDKGGAIWKLDTNHGPRSIKVLHRDPHRSLFSVYAQDYIVRQGGRVPGLILTKDDNSYVHAGGKIWIVTEWIEPLEPVSKIDLEGAAVLSHGLGEFHKISKGYVPPAGIARSSRIYKWENYYEKVIAKIGWFRHIAEAYSETTSSSHLLSVLDLFENQALEMFELFKQSSYNKMVLKGEAYWGLAHQDYGWSNGQMGTGGIWVIDLDGVAYDLPIRDLRKIITSTMDDMGFWDIYWIRGVIEAYHQANPIDQETFELLWIDMAFPNEFYKHVKEIVYDPVTFMNTELEGILQRITLTESNKWEVLSELLQDKANYPAGDYAEVEVPSLIPDTSETFVFQRNPLVIPVPTMEMSPTELQLVEVEPIPLPIASGGGTPWFADVVLPANPISHPPSSKIIVPQFRSRRKKRRVKKKIRTYKPTPSKNTILKKKHSLSHPKKRRSSTHKKRKGLPKRPWLNKSVFPVRGTRTTRRERVA